MGRQAAAVATGLVAAHGDPGAAFFDAIADDPEEAQRLHAAHKGQIIQQEAMARGGWQS